MLTVFNRGHALSLLPQNKYHPILRPAQASAGNTPHGVPHADTTPTDASPRDRLPAHLSALQEAQFASLQYLYAHLGPGALGQELIRAQHLPAGKSRDYRMLPCQS